MNKVSLLTSDSPDDEDDIEYHEERSKFLTSLATKPGEYKKGTYLPRFMEDLIASNPSLRDVEPIITSLQHAFQSISRIIQRAALDGLTGYANVEETNVQGEQQKKLDLITNDILKDALISSRKVSVMISEEDEHEIVVDDPNDDNSKYIVAFDPLDGSSNTDTNVPIGSIFSIYKADGTRSLLSQPLSKTLVGAGYCFYSSATSFAFALEGNDDGEEVSKGGGVHAFTFDDDVKEFVLTHPTIRIPERGTTYSVNEANKHTWDAALQTYLNDIQCGQGETSTKYSLRYIGSMVGDIHRTLLNGGIFGYPSDSKNKQGKLRLLYEVAPMSYLLERAGGLAISFGANSEAANTGSDAKFGRRVLDIVPQSIHERTPVLMGSYDDMVELQKYYYYESDGNPDDGGANKERNNVVEALEARFKEKSGLDKRLELSLQEYLEELEAWC